MPELPEVETVVRDLRPHLTGRRIRSVQAGKQALRKPWSAAWEPLVVGRRITQVRRRGKWILLDLGDGMTLVFHLGLTGQLTVTPARSPRADHTHLVFGLARGQKELRFRDIRRFGSATLFADAAALDAFFRDAGLGPEPFDLQPQYFRQRLAATGRCLKAVLLDQGVVAGVGNIYADEVLFEARLHPSILGRAATAAQAHPPRPALVTLLPPG